jgi:hypothetical protein
MACLKAEIQSSPQKKPLLKRCPEAGRRQEKDTRGIVKEPPDL